MLSALALTACGGGTTTKQESAPTQVKLRAGVNDPQDKSVAVLMFLPQAIKVAKGATVEWTVNGPEPHTITFPAAGQKPPAPDAPDALAPKPPTGPYDGSTLVSSGLGPTGPQPMAFKLTFNKAGKFAYACIIHPTMTGSVEVMDSGADAQADIDSRGKSEESQWLAEGRAAKKQFVEKPVKSEKAADGSTTYFVEMGTTTPHTDILAFQPMEAAIKAGDRVVFVNNSAAPHTASFPGTKSLPQNPESPEAMTAAPGKSPQTLNATDLFNSGWLPPNAPPGAGPPEAARSFTFNVPAAGTYGYVCLLHVPSGMQGTIKAT